MKARNDLVVANDRLHEMTLQCMENETQLKRERLIKDIAVSCIQEDKLDEFELRCPLVQPQWNCPSLPLVSTTLPEADFGKAHQWHLKIESGDLP